MGLGLKAIEPGYRVLFTTAAGLITTLTKALAEGRLDDRSRSTPSRGCSSSTRSATCPIDQAGANLFFQLISRRYERGPMILTSNQSFGSWGEVFGDRVIATGDPRPHPPSRHHPQHPRQLLPAQGQAQSRPRPAGRGHELTPGGWGLFDDPKWGNLGDP